jgi:hypothetical protein
VTIQPPVVMPDDPLTATEEALRFQQQQNDTICRITDFRQVQLTFADMVEGMAADEAFRSPHICSVVIGSDPMIKVGTRGFKQIQYGGVDVPLVTTREQAIQQARRLLDASDNSDT